ncbi:unnamed protein product [Mytilus coruscus]|uniref:Zinc finger PHD-type domain-containing protein n=1 Tax=Mytilus coruscus TaxID=42192 RepID=A0A6J8C1C9_MYTCO|nr:unnamed protein product [Mytilus coruscus]
MLKFTINLYHTSCSMIVNGKRVDLFINDIIDDLCEKVKKEYNEIELLNKSIESYLSHMKNYTSKVIQKSITNKEIHPENEQADQFKNMNNSQTKNFTRQILDTQYIESDKNICPGCRKYVDDGIGCDRCDFWYHYECENITSNIGNEALRHIEYICRFCNDDMLYENRNHLECDANEESNIVGAIQTVKDFNSKREKDHPQNADNSKKNKDTNIDSGDTVQCTRKLISVDENNTFNKSSQNASQSDPEEETILKSVVSPKPSKTSKKITEDSTTSQPNDKKKMEGKHQYKQVRRENVPNPIQQ